MRMLKVIFLLVVMVFGGSLASDGASVSKIVGSNVDCTGCVVFPLAGTVLCQAPETCTRLLAPDWSNANVFYGSNSSCRKSIDGGDTWANCGSNPSATNYFNYAVTMNGTVLAGGNDAGGTVTRIRRSIDGATSWSTVYDSAPIDSNSAQVANGRLRCVQDEDICYYYGRDVANELWYLTGTNDGQNWSLTMTGLTDSLPYSIFSFDNLGTAGMAMGGGSVGTARSILFTGVVFDRSNQWPTTNGGFCNWPYIMNGADLEICHDTNPSRTYTIRDENGIVQSSFELPDVPSDNGGAVGLALSLVPNWIAMIRQDTAGSTGVWVSIDSGGTFTKLMTVNPAGFGINAAMQASIFKGVNNCMYASWLANGSDTVIRIC